MEIDCLGLNRSLNGYRCTGIGAARCFPLESHRTAWRRPIPCRGGLNAPFGLADATCQVGAWSNALELEDAAGFCKGLGDIGRSVVAHHLTTLNATTAEPG